MIKLAYHTHVPVVYCGSQIRIASYMGRELDTLAKHFGAIILWCYTANKFEEKRGKLHF